MDLVLCQNYEKGHLWVDLFLSLLFDDVCTVLYDRIPLEKVTKMAENQYYEIRNVGQKDKRKDRRRRFFEGEVECRIIVENRMKS